MREVEGLVEALLLEADMVARVGHTAEPLLRQAAATLAEAQAEVAELREDGRRYRWLKERMDAGMVNMIVDIEPDGLDEISRQVETAIDAAIDAAGEGA